MERRTGMRNRLVVLSAVMAFAVGVAAVAVVAGSGGDGGSRLEKLSFAFAAAGAAERSSMALGAPDMASPQFGPPEYEVRGELPALGGEAPAYRLADEMSKAKVAELASRLGLAGDVEASAEGWTVRGDERELSVLRVPGVPWYLSPACEGTPTGPDAPASSTSSDRGVVSSAGCAYGLHTTSGGGEEPSSTPPPDVAVARAPATVAVAPCPRGAMDCRPATEAPTTTAVPPCPAGGSCAYSEAPSPADRDAIERQPSPPVPAPPPAVRPADLPSRAEAERIARSFFADGGVSLDRFELNDGFSQWFATVQPPVGGLSTVGWGHSVAVGPKGEIVTGNGYLSEPERIGDYPLAGTAKGLERLRSGTGGGWSAFEGGVDRGSETVSADCAGPDLPCDRPVPVTTAPASEGPTATSGSCPAGTECLDAPASPPQVAPDGPAAHDGPAAPAGSPPRPVIVITGVHLALQYAGAALVPVYVFELEGGGETFPVPAVTDEWIADHVEEGPGAPEDRPRPVPMPAPVPDPAPTPAPAPMRAPGPPPTSAPPQVEGQPAPVG